MSTKVPHASHRFVAPLAMVCALAAQGCQSKPTAAGGDAGANRAMAMPEAGGAGSCRVFAPAKHELATCIDYVGSDYTRDTAPNVCTTNVRSGPSEYAPEPCPSSNRVGSCDVNAGTSVATIWRSYPAGAAGDQSSCAAAGGTWKAN